MSEFTKIKEQIDDFKKFIDEIYVDQNAMRSMINTEHKDYKGSESEEAYKMHSVNMVKCGAIKWNLDRLIRLERGISCLADKDNYGV